MLLIYICIVEGQVWRDPIGFFEAGAASAYGIVELGVDSSFWWSTRSIDANSRSIGSRGRSLTTFTKLELFLTTYLPTSMWTFFTLNEGKNGHLGQKWTFLDHLPTSFCPRSYWTAPRQGKRERRPWKPLDTSKTGRQSGMPDYYVLLVNSALRRTLLHFSNKLGNNSLPRGNSQTR